MSENALNYMQDEFIRTIDYARKEFDITYAEVVGILDIVKHIMLEEFEAKHASSDDTEDWRD